MKPTEAVKLVAIVRALCPGQKWDDASPEAWHAILGEYSFADCQAAVRTVYRERGNPEEFGPRRIEPDDINREVKAIRARRLDAVPYEALLPPAELAGDPAAEVAWRRRAVAAAANGDRLPDNGRGVLKARDMRALTQHARRSTLDA